MLVPGSAQDQLSFAQEALTLAEQSNYRAGIAYAKIAQGNAHLELGMKNLAQAELEEAVSLSRHLTSDIEVDALSNLAQVFYSKKLSVNESN